MDLKLLSSEEFDALLIPGGFGIARNLSDYAFKGKNMCVHEDVSTVLHDFHSTGKVIGMTSSAPILAAKVLGMKKLKITLGRRGKDFPYSEVIDLATSFGNNLVEMDVKETCVDWQNMIVTSPCYMKENASYYEVFEGIDKLVRHITSLVRQ
jgi:enhancing lycopene biosynthesis protein 2